MNPKITILCAALYLALASTAAAQTAPEASSAASAAETPPTTEPAAAGKSLLPRLSIKWQCKQECTPNEKVPPLIEQAYAQAAAKAGYTVGGSEVAEVTIVDFRQRPPGVRATLGIFAGKDRLGVRIAYRGQQAEVEDYSANAMQGMNSLSEAVGKRSYERIASIFKSTQTP